jgi:GAF domain-containing protein
MPSMRGVLENTLGGILGLGIIAASAWGISHIEAPLSLWIVFLIAAATLAIGFGAGRASRYGDELLGYQSDLLKEAILALREVVAGKLSLSFDDFIERGVLAPARFGLSAERGEEIRLSVLRPSADGVFGMLYESGHSLGRKENFSLPKASMAGHALETGEMQWTNHVDADDRWRRHPKADHSRSYKSLACVPIIVGDKAVAVLNVLSSAKGAFLTSDLTYIELLGSFIGLAWALTDDAGGPNRVADRQESKTVEGKGR